MLKPMQTRPSMETGQGTWVIAGGTVQAKSQSPNASEGQAMAKEVTFVSGRTWCA